MFLNISKNIQKKIKHLKKAKRFRRKLYDLKGNITVKLILEKIKFPRKYKSWLFFLMKMYDYLHSMIFWYKKVLKASKCFPKYLTLYLAHFDIKYKISHKLFIFW